MLANQHTSAATTPEEPFRYPRSETVRILQDSLNPMHSGQSRRAAAATAGIPHTTLRYWQQRQHPSAAPEQLIDFFESPVGLAFLKRLLLALHLVFQQQGTSGIRPLCRFLELAALTPFVAASYGSHQHLATLLQQLLADYDQEQRQQLAPTMPPKDITLCEDENFHSVQLCLVAIEPISNFLVLEVYQPQRDANTWNCVVQTALEGLPVRVIQVTSDLARGLQAHAQDGLQAQHSPDLMHVQADLHKATSLPLHRHLETAQQRLQEVQQTVQDLQERYQLHQAGIRSPGRPPDFEQDIRWAQDAEQHWQQQVQQRQEQQRQLQEAIRGLGDDYHPFDSQSGQAVSAESMQQRLQQRFETVQRLARAAGVSEAGQQKIAKARRVLPRLVASLVWFWHSVGLLVESLQLSAQVQGVVYQQLLPGLYWQAAAERGRTAQDKRRLRGLAKEWLAKAWSAGGVLRGLQEPLQQAIKNVAAEGVSRFVRSSSCVEGRNGQLALHHHGSHTLSPGKLRALTVLHNYFIEHADGSTAAERFFGKKPANLFEWLLERFPDPPRPAKQRRKATKVPA